MNTPCPPSNAGFGSRGARRVRILASCIVVAVFACVAASASVAMASRAAFGASADVDLQDAPAITLSDDARGALFSGPPMVPGDRQRSKITITMEGQAEPSHLRLYGHTHDGDGGAQREAGFASKLNLRVGVAPGGNEVFEGTVAEFTSRHRDYGSGAAASTPTQGTSSRTYYLEVELDPSTGNEYIGMTATMRFVWEARSGASDLSEVAESA